MLITACRVQIDHIGRLHLRKVCCRVTATNGTVKPQHFEVMLSKGTEVRVLFHINALFEDLRHPIEIHSKAACQVDIAPLNG